jgi:hypothetical protein
MEGQGLLFIGDDWAEGHHDVVAQDEAGKTLARRRLPEGADGITRFHELVASCWGEDGEPDLAWVVVVIETDRGPWVKALAAAGYQVYPANPKQAARHKETIAVSGKKDDFFDAAGLADMGRTRRHQMRELAADSDIAEAVKIAARAHQKLIWERTRHLLRMRSALREYFPAALEAYAGLSLAGTDTLELLGKAPDPASAAKLTTAQITAALKRAGRRGDLAQRARDIQAALRTEHLAQPDVVAEAYAASVQAGAAVIAALNAQIKVMETKVSELFRRHPDAGAYLSQPGIGDITGARILGEYGDAPGRYASAKARKNYAGTSPLTIQSGKRKTVHARYIRNRHLIDALHAQALSSLSASPGARAFYDELRAREIGHDDAMRRVATRLTGILHGCLKHGRDYDEAAAWSHRLRDAEAA